MGLQKVSSLMNVVLVSVSPRASLREAAQRMREADVGSVLVTDGPHLLGILTERDIVAAMAESLDCAATKVEHAMSSPVTVVDPETEIAAAAEMMATGGIRHIPVVEEDRVLGMISVRDIVRWGAGSLRWNPGSEAGETLEVLSRAGRHPSEPAAT